MNEPISVKLNQLLENTKLFLTLYNVKKQWQTVYPAVCKLSEQYRELYEQYPVALQARCAVFNPKYSYSVNLVINQCVLTAALCKSQQYNNQLSELYICAALVDHLCVGEQLNKLSKQLKFSDSDKRIWQLRHQLTAKIILTGGDSAKPITQVLAKLSKYKQALVTTPKIMLYDGGITLVAIANIIAMNITYSPSKQHISLFKALGDLYIRTPNLFAQQLIKFLIAHIGPLLPGSRVIYNDQLMVYLASDNQQRHILINVENKNKNKIAWYRVKALLNSNAIQWQSNDSRIQISVWDSEHMTSTANILNNGSLALIELISRLKLQHEYSYKALSQIMAPYPNVIENLCEAVKPYNNEHQAAKSLKHSLSMVGYFNAPAIIQRVIFEQLVKVTPHPLQQFVLTRLECIVEIIALLVSKNKMIQFEHIALPLYGYAYFLLTQCSTHISRKIMIDETPNTTLNTPISAFFGVSSLDTEQLKAQLTLLLSDNPWAIALLEAEHLPKKQLNERSKLWVAIKALTQTVFKPQLKLSTWQQQILDQQLTTQKWENHHLFNEQLQELALSNTI
ncbi:hypothetical protein EU508_16490 [Pseudoalteromonas fuliginea]|uniref:Histidine kinase n=1 Tax=Pseudoalteromonas fuliginea TaxID=1872678 RepID=A0AB73BDC6_9GAMM|nr:hypothetical protein [Pseudoalteromonas fuliginea]KAA1157332.1 hypothetical protein EU508_16490 [Pseudoalteromonas fuliginea]